MSGKRGYPKRGSCFNNWQCLEPLCGLSQIANDRWNFACLIKKGIWVECSIPHSWYQSWRSPPATWSRTKCWLPFTFCSRTFQFKSIFLLCRAFVTESRQFIFRTNIDYISAESYQKFSNLINLFSWLPLRFFWLYLNKKL